jgi:hypothetical protein
MKSADNGYLAMPTGGYKYMFVVKFARFKLQQKRKVVFKIMIMLA